MARSNQAKTPLEPIVSAGGDYQLIITNTSNGCSAVASVMVPEDTQVPSVDAGSPAQLDCAVLSLDLDGSTNAGNPEVVWTTNNGQIVSGEHTLNPTIDAPGDYLLTVTDLDNGCADQASVTISQDILAPTATINSPGQLDCQTNIVTLDGSNSISRGYHPIPMDHE